MINSWLSILAEALGVACRIWWQKETHFKKTSWTRANVCVLNHLVIYYTNLLKALQVYREALDTEFRDQISYLITEADFKGDVH